MLFLVLAILRILFVMTLSYLMDSKDKILGKIGKCTLIILCIHGPIYRILIKVFSIIVKSSTDAVRQNIIYALVITFVDIAICYYVYKFLANIYLGVLEMSWIMKENIKKKTNKKGKE